MGSARRLEAARWVLDSERIVSRRAWEYSAAHKTAGRKITAPAVINGFHTYALLWTPTNYTFYVDGKEVWQTAVGGVSQAPEYIKFSEEIGDWAGNIREAKLPDYFEIDYVRIYDVVAEQK